MSKYLEPYNPKNEEHYEFRKRQREFYDKYGIDTNITTIKPMEIKQSKIKAIAECKPFTNSYGTTYYHNLEMENGDKINIGKKKEMQVGWEITYKIVEHGQQEYQKAKSAKLDEMPEGMKQNIQKAVKAKDDRELGMRAGHCVTGAIYLMTAGVVILDSMPENATMKERLKATALEIAKLTEEIKNEL